MPNWVYNNMSVSGSTEDLIAFREKAGKAHKTYFTGVRSKNEDGEYTYDADAIDENENEEPLSFWNFVRPADEILPVYFGHEKENKPDGYEEWSMEDKLAHDFKFSGNNSYDWNITNWGVKWDAGDVGFEDESNMDGSLIRLNYNFSTAWGIPEKVFTAICEQHPELEFTFDAEEEQGWGAEYSSSKVDGAEDGEPTSTLILVKEWDSPDSHADYVERDRTDSCVCSWEEDEDEWYEDCPKSETDFVVVVERRYIVRATSAEQAWEHAQEQLETLTPEDLDVSWVLDENSGQRLFPVLEE